MQLHYHFSYGVQEGFKVCTMKDKEIYSFPCKNCLPNFTNRKAEESREIPLHVPSPLILFIVAHLCMIIMYLAPPRSHPETK